VTRYVVHRDLSPDVHPNASNYIGEVLAPATTFVDTSPDGDAFYVVVAVDSAGHASGCPPAVRASPLSDAGHPPAALALRRIAPNPANPGAWIEYELESRREAALEIYAANGVRVRTLLGRRMDAGRHRTYWDGADDAGRQVSSGVYWVCLQAGGDQRAAKLVVVR
jgi:hypothetical protein